MKVKDIQNRHKEFLSIARYCGMDEDTAKDVVQDTFLKLLEIEGREGSIDRITYKGNLNMVYVFNMIRNASIDILKANGMKVGLYNCIGLIDSSFSSASDYDNTQHVIDEILGDGESSHYYQNLKDAYYTQDTSLRRFSQDTGIHYMTIYRDIKELHSRIAEGLGDELDDLRYDR